MNERHLDALQLLIIRKYVPNIFASFLQKIGISLRATRVYRCSFVVLCDLRLEPVPKLCLSLSHALLPLQFALNPFSRSQNFTLQVERTALLGIVQVKQSLESLCDSLCLYYASLARADVQDLAGLVHGDVGAREGAATAASGICGGILLRCGGLTVRFGDGASDDTSA